MHPTTTIRSRASRRGWSGVRAGSTSRGVVAGHPVRAALALARQGPGLHVVVTSRSHRANAAIFSVVREVLLRPLVNRDEDA